MPASVVSAVTLCIALCCSGAASAQGLIGQWIEVRVSARVLAPKDADAPLPEPLTQKPAVTTVKQTVYLNMITSTTVDGLDEYIVGVWREQEDGDIEFENATASLTIAQKGVVPRMTLTVPLDGGGTIDVDVAGRLSAKPTKLGLFKGGLRGVRGRVVGTVDGSAVSGTVRLRAKFVPDSKIFS